MLENLRMSLRLSETLSFEGPFSHPSPNPSHNTYTLNFPSRNRGLYFTTGLLFLTSKKIKSENLFLIMGLRVVSLSEALH